MPTAGLAGVEVEPDATSLPAGLSTTLHAFALYDDGSRVERNSDVEWINSSPQFAELDEDVPGLLHALLPGTTAVSVTLEAFAAASIVEVLDADVLGLVVTPLQAEVPVGQWIDYAAIGLLSDGSHADVTEAVQWTSSVPGVADFDLETPQRLVARSPGLASVLAVLGEVEASVPVEVGDRELLELTITPSSLDLPLGTVGALAARGRWSDDVEEDVTSQAVWTSTSLEVATVSAGLIAGVDTGTTLVEARLFGVESSVLVTVGPPVEVSLEVLPSALTLALGEPGALQATLHLSDDSEEDVTDGVAWSSAAPEVASASNDAGRQGIVSSVGTGTATIMATRGTLSSFASVQVGAAELAEITVEPAILELALGDPGSFTAEGVWSDGSTADLTGSVSWSIDPLGIGALGTAGTVTPLTAGAATVTASSGLISADAALTVGPAELRSIAVTPVDVVLAVGEQQPLMATGTWSNNAVSDVTEDAFWGSSAPGFASVTNTAGQEGTVTAEAPGVATILASHSLVSGSVVLEVVPPAPSSIEIVPPADLFVGSTVSLELTVVWSDESESAEVAAVFWSSDDPGVLTTSNDVGLEGTIVGVSPGLATVNAAFENLSTSLVIEVLPTN